MAWLARCSAGERVADVDRDIECHAPGILPVGGDIGPDALHGRDVERRVGRIAQPFDISAGLDAEEFLGDDRRVVAYGSSREEITSRKARVTQGIHCEGEIAAALQVDAVAAVGRKVDGSLYVVVDVDVQGDVQASDPYGRQLLEDLAVVDFVERDERNEML